MTEQDLIDALELARHQAVTAEGALTVAELVERMGISTRRVRIHLGALHEDGRLHVVRRQGTTISGQKKWIPAYRLVKGEPGDG